MNGAEVAHSHRAAHAHTPFPADIRSRTDGTRHTDVHLNIIEEGILLNIIFKVKCNNVEERITVLFLFFIIKNSYYFNSRPAHLEVNLGE